MPAANWREWKARRRAPVPRFAGSLAQTALEDVRNAVRTPFGGKSVFIKHRMDLLRKAYPKVTWRQWEAEARVKPGALEWQASEAARSRIPLKVAKQKFTAAQKLQAPTPEVQKLLREASDAYHAQQFPGKSVFVADRVAKLQRVTGAERLPIQRLLGIRGRRLAQIMWEAKKSGTGLNEAEANFKRATTSLDSPQVRALLDQVRQAWNSRDEKSIQVATLVARLRKLTGAHEHFIAERVGAHPGTFKATVQKGRKFLHPSMLSRQHVETIERYAAELREGKALRIRGKHEMGAAVEALAEVLGRARMSTSTARKKYHGLVPRDVLDRAIARAFLERTEGDT